MDGELGLLVDHGQMLVLVDDRELNLRCVLDRAGLAWKDGDQLAEAQLVSRALERTVNPNKTIVDQVPGLVPRSAVQTSSEELVEPFPILVGHQLQRWRW